MGGHDHHEIPKVPDWRIYKVEDVPQLVAIRDNLASINLKNPWLRNHVWYYTEYINHPDGQWRGPKRVFWKAFKYALPAAILTTLIHKAYLNYTKPAGSHH